MNEEPIRMFADDAKQYVFEKVIGRRWKPDDREEFTRGDRDG
ncbi:hypothetical protein ACFO0N_09870 [Halobium salinum]|uniref:Uncharacterized protein n=1 Tax=Halobium salinum TaxID=1364940 RepID=A0ABD5PBG5_9EURY|nr:hypothetical protein [Halobium salinum]